MTINKVVSDLLRGQPFIRAVESYIEPEDILERQAYGDSVERKCGLCFYGYGPKEHTENCSYGTKPKEHKPKKFFGINPKDPLPDTLDGKEVAQYCPFFHHHNLLEFEDLLMGDMLLEGVQKGLIKDVVIIYHPKNDEK
jgi:hypothetical protein